MYVVKLIDDAGNVSDCIMANDDYEIREAVRNFALEIEVGEKIVVE